MLLVSFFFFKAKTKHEQKFVHTYPLLAILTGLLIHNVWFLCSRKKLDRNEAISFPPSIQMMLFVMQSHKFVNTMCPLSLSCMIQSLLLWQWHMIFACCTFLTVAVTQHLCCSVPSSAAASSTPVPWVGWETHVMCRSFSSAVEVLGNAKELGLLPSRSVGRVWERIKKDLLVSVTRAVITQHEGGCGLEWGGQSSPSPRPIWWGAGLQPCWAWFSFSWEENKLGTNLLSVVFVQWLWENTLMYLNHIYALHKPKHPGGFAWPKFGKVQWAPTSLFTEVCSTPAWAEVSLWLPLCKEGTPSVWECVWQCVGVCLAVGLRPSASMSQKRTCASLWDRKSRTLWKEVGGVLSLARSMLQERLGCNGSEYVAVQGNE